MNNKVCIQTRDDIYICSEEWYDEHKNDDEFKSGAKYEVLNKGYILDMADLINYCLTYNYDIDIPNEYKVTTIYTITFSTANFDPNNRTYSNVNTYGLFSSTDKKYIENKFKSICKTRKECNYEGYNTKRHYCWHTEDYAYNQIIHSYDINETYIIDKI